MAYLLKMLSDMLQKPSTTFSYPHMSLTKIQTRPHRFDISGATVQAGSCHVHHRAVKVQLSLGGFGNS